MLFNEQKNTSPESIMLQASMGATLSKALSIVAKLNIADLLVEGSKNADELAKATGTQTPFLYRILHFLTSFEIFAEDEQRYFSLTPLSNTLRTDLPTSTREWIIFNTEPWRWEILQSMMDVIVNGKNAYQNLYQTDPYTFFYSHPEIGMAFSKAMNSWSSSLPNALVQAYDFSNVKIMADLGGGFGNLLFPILKSYPQIHGILLDVLPVVEQVQKLNTYQEVADHCEIIAGDFFTSIPKGCDIYMFANVLVDITDEVCITLLKNCHNTMAKDSRLLIVEHLEGYSYQSNIGKFVDIMMLLETFGRIRKEEEWKNILQKANFILTKVIPLDVLSMYIIEAIPNA